MATDLLLEHEADTVTEAVNEYGDHFEIAKKRCKCWFCPDCCKVMGYDLRKRLFPILETFSGLLLVTFTVDPCLFPSPKSAYLYIRERRCIARTIQDLSRWGYLFSRRYFYVVEWQRNTEQAHFHVLVDARFIPWHELLRSWSKHRPEGAGPVIGDRPAFGTALISIPCFKGGPAHAARYVTKYLTKVPEYGFPEWVLELGKETRIRRYSASRGFWGSVSERRIEGSKERQCEARTYAERVQTCGASVNVFEVNESVNRETGEILVTRQWVGELLADADVVMDRLFDPGEPRRSRRSLLARSASDAQEVVSAAIGREAVWIRGGPAHYGTAFDSCWQALGPPPANISLSVF
jgi:hypothetical protein